MAIKQKNRPPGQAVQGILPQQVERGARKKSDRVVHEKQHPQRSLPQILPAPLPRHQYKFYPPPALHRLSSRRE